ncbi:MAG: metallophosphoesterase family protein [Candidatus Omnitrophota bacterium]|nr:metallophosphoesterase family protein [Candidatus Omnitrophota bacterium]
MDMRIGVISDTHISDNTVSIPKKVLDGLKGIDMIIHAGDFVDLSVLEKLKNICNNVQAVYGNMDYAQVKEELPQEQLLDIGKYKIGLTHGYGAPDKLIGVLSVVFKDKGVDIIIFGHSHTPVNEKRGEILFFNPGSPTDKVFAPYNSFGIIEITDKIEARIVKI